MKQSAINPGIIYIIVGIFLLIVIGGSLVLRLLGICLALYFINYGLQKIGYPPLLVLIPALLDEVHKKFK